MIDTQHNITTLCKTSQCKKKQWCKRYQLYICRSKNTDTSIQHLKIPWISVINIDFNDFDVYEHAKLRQLIDNCKCFVPTEQYLIKKKLEKLNNL